MYVCVCIHRALRLRSGLCFPLGHYKLKMFMVNVAWSRTTHTYTYSVSHWPWHLFLRWLSEYILNCPQPQPPHPCLSIQFSIIIQVEMDVRGPLHMSVSLFFFSLFFSFLPHTLLWTKNLTLIKCSTFYDRDGEEWEERGHLDGVLC